VKYNSVITFSELKPFFKTNNKLPCFDPILRFNEAYIDEEILGSSLAIAFENAKNRYFSHFETVTCDVPTISAMMRELNDGNLS